MTQKKQDFLIPNIKQVHCLCIYVDETGMVKTKVKSEFETVNIVVRRVTQGNFLRVTFRTKRSTKVYVGQILAQEGNSLEVTFLMALNSDRKTFSFSQKEDKSWVDTDEVEVLPDPLLNQQDSY